MAMKKIYLHGNKGNGVYAIVDDEYYGELSKYKWTLTNTGYAQRSDRTPMHRYIMKPPSDYVVDHINMNKLDNRKENLRIATRAENTRNSRVKITNSSGYKGVMRDERRNHWRAEITKDYKSFHLGVFDTAEDAAHAYDFAAAELFKDFAVFNFPKGRIKPPETLVSERKNVSGYRGVSWHKKRAKWSSQIIKKGVRYFLGYYDCKHDAAEAYNEKSKEINGHLAKLNVVKREVSS